jgi:hypothetical protein
VVNTTGWGAQEDVVEAVDIWLAAEDKAQTLGATHVGVALEEENATPASPSKSSFYTLTHRRGILLVPALSH